jgi:hypothetical protein
MQLRYRERGTEERAAIEHLLFLFFEGVACFYCTYSLDVLHLPLFYSQYVAALFL